MSSTNPVVANAIASNLYDARGSKIVKVDTTRDSDAKIKASTSELKKITREMKDIQQRIAKILEPMKRIPDGSEGVENAYLDAKEELGAVVRKIKTDVVGM